MPTELLKDSLATALKKLEARENSMRQFEELSNLGSWEVDLITKQSLWSSQTYKIYGFDNSIQPNLNLFFSRLIEKDLPRA
jgi:putative two-component system response regulator